MGVDLVGKLQGFKISRENFIEETDGSTENGCIEKGHHRVLRFNMVTYNIGDKDLVIGDPRDPTVQAKYFEPFDEKFTEGLGYRFKAKPFFAYSLRNDDSTVNISGYKDAFCFDGLEPESCYNQGLAAGGEKRDVYGSNMACQFVVIDNVPDGEYTLEATVNAPSVDAVKNGKGEIFFEEDNYDNNTVAVRLQIKGDMVTKL
jgi:lysyl oxidase